MELGASVEHAAAAVEMLLKGAEKFSESAIDARTLQLIRMAAVALREASVPVTINYDEVPPDWVNRREPDMELPVVGVSVSKRDAFLRFYSDLPQPRFRSLAHLTLEFREETPVQQVGQEYMDCFSIIQLPYIRNSLKTLFIRQTNTRTETFWLDDLETAKAIALNGTVGEHAPWKRLRVLTLHTHPALLHAFLPATDDAAPKPHLPVLEELTVADWNKRFIATPLRTQPQLPYASAILPTVSRRHLPLLDRLNVWQPALKADLAGSHATGWCIKACAALKLQTLVFRCFVSIQFESAFARTVLPQLPIKALWMGYSASLPTRWLPIVSDTCKALRAENWQFFYPMVIAPQKQCFFDGDPIALVSFIGYVMVMMQSRQLPAANRWLVNRTAIQRGALWEGLETSLRTMYTSFKQAEIYEDARAEVAKMQGLAMYPTKGTDRGVARDFYVAVLERLTSRMPSFVWLDKEEFEREWILNS